MSIVPIVGIFSDLKTNQGITGDVAHHNEMSLGNEWYGVVNIPIVRTNIKTTFEKL